MREALLAVMLTACSFTSAPPLPPPPPSDTEVTRTPLPSGSAAPVSETTGRAVGDSCEERQAEAKRQFEVWLAEANKKAAELNARCGEEHIDQYLRRNYWLCPEGRVMKRDALNENLGDRLRSEMWKPRCGRFAPSIRHGVESPSAVGE